MGTGVLNCDRLVGRDEGRRVSIAVGREVGLDDGADERAMIPTPVICNLPLQDAAPKQPCLTV